MPRAQVKKTATKTNPAGRDDYGEIDRMGDSPQYSENDEDVTVKGKKRGYEEKEAEGGGDFTSEMHKMLNSFGADITKTLANKRKRLELFTHSSLKTSNKKVEDIWTNQHTEREKLNEEFGRQISAVFQQWDADLEKSKEQEDKLQNLYRQQQKFFQQTRVVQSQRLKTIRQLYEQYTKGMDNLEKCHEEQQGSVHSELKKEMALLQKKILMDTQQQEMANVRKSLQTMLF